MIRHLLWDRNTDKTHRNSGFFAEEDPYVEEMSLFQGSEQVDFLPVGIKKIGSVLVTTKKVCGFIYDAAEVQGNEIAKVTNNEVAWGNDPKDIGGGTLVIVREGGDMEMYECFAEKVHDGLQPDHGVMFFLLIARTRKERSEFLGQCQSCTVLDENPFKGVEQARGFFHWQSRPCDDAAKDTAEKTDPGFINPLSKGLLA